MHNTWTKLDNEIIYPASVVIGKTSDDTLENLIKIRKYCNEHGKFFTLMFFEEQLSDLKRRYFEKGNIPGISKLSTLPDFILYVEKDESIKIIKERIKRS